MKCISLKKPCVPGITFIGRKQVCLALIQGNICDTSVRCGNAVL